MSVLDTEKVVRRVVTGSVKHPFPDADFVHVIDNGRTILRIDKEDNVMWGDGLTPEEAIVRAFKIIYPQAAGS